MEKAQIINPKVNCLLKVLLPLVVLARKVRKRVQASLKEVRNQILFLQLAALTVNLVTSGLWTRLVRCMCPKRDLFSTYKSVNGGSVLMENDMACKIIGVGWVKIRMFDEIVIILYNIWDIPYLKRNLISLGTLNYLGFLYMEEKGGIRVNSDSKQ